MKDYELSGHQAPSTEPPVESELKDSESADDVIVFPPHPDSRPRLCLECQQPLERGERKVHRGGCAHQREIHLQQLRRRRQRR